MVTTSGNSVCSFVSYRTQIGILLDFLIRVESEPPKSRYVDFRLLVYFTEKHLYD